MQHENKGSDSIKVRILWLMNEVAIVIFREKIDQSRFIIFEYYVFEVTVVVLEYAYFIRTLNTTLVFKEATR